jgi:hypothetical protein
MNVSERLTAAFKHCVFNVDLACMQTFNTAIRSTCTLCILRTQATQQAVLCMQLGPRQCV